VVEVTVTAAERTKIILVPQAPQVAKETTTQMVAKAVYNDGSEEVVTNAVIWTSSNSDLATISNSLGSQGRATGIATGTVTITAATLGKAETAPLTITAQ
jgi:uncharacterized protein YjdB